jgi:L-amino acid N-acyltransferase YncA
MSDDLSIRAAQPADWPRIWPFWRRIVGSGDTYMWEPSTDEAAARAAWMQQPPTVVFVAEQAGTVVATAFLRPAQPGLGDHVANAAFMVDPDHAGGGIGRRLAEHVMAQARELGYMAMQFNAVVETNAGAVELWRSLGFRVLATVPNAFRHATQGPVGVHVMHREL